MHKEFLAQAGFQSDFARELLIYLTIAVGVFLTLLYTFRAIFNIPSFLRYQKAQIRLLEEIAKKQGVENTTVRSIISESQGWDAAPSQSGQSTTSVQ